MYYLPYNINLKEFSRDLRKNMTKGEVLLWNVLKGGKIKGYTFNRQKPLKYYIVDFYCKPLNLVIEVDGKYHLNPEVAIRDAKRQVILEKMGLQFIRYTEEEVVFHRPRVVDALMAKVEQIELGRV
ncbi:MAG TPA: endonuclease domain-containing protein [Flavobacteriales bacterium]|nr:endonuclease domain-containing protein [Flavobacteriales bacterium]